MSLTQSPHKADLHEAGWHSRGYLPHFDGRAIPQFITLRLFDSVPAAVSRRWVQEMDLANLKHDRITLNRRIERYLDQGYGEAFMKINSVAEMIQNELLYDDGQGYRLSSWVVMPNHIHYLLTRFETIELAQLMQSFKSLIAQSQQPPPAQGTVLDARLF